MPKNATAENRATALQPFAEAERVRYVDQTGQDVVFVVLAVVTAVGNDFALVTREEDLGTGQVSAFEYHTDEDGEASFAPIETEDLYEDVMHLFADLTETEEV